jgi:hypothetical protein
MGNSNKLTNGTPILRLKLTTTDGRVIEREVQAGRDTSEWAYDRPDVKAEIQHDRAPLADTWTAADFQGHSYLARLPFDRAEITKIEIIHVPDTAELTIYQVTLFDAANNRSTPLSQYAVTPARWRKLNTFGSIEVYENLTALPRAWFARRAEVMPSRDVLQTIKSGQLPSGGAFNPAETVLFEKEDFGARPPTPPPMGDPTGAEVNITRYEPQRIELQTRNSQPGFLVLSEIYYRGWDAWVDGQRVPVERVNYVLRGLALAPGAHRVEFVFRAHSFRNGAVYSLLGALLLLAGAVISGTGMGGGWRRRINEQPWLRKLEDRASASTARFQQSVLGNPRGLLKRLPAHAELLAVALLGLCSLWYLYGLNLVGQPIRSDGVGYYLYLPNVLLRHTLDLDTVAREQFKPLERWLSIRPWPETGRYLNAYAPGESVLLTPFFLLGHAVALVTHAKPDGFSWPYQYAVALGGLVYVIAGLYLLKRALLSHFAPRVVWLTLLVITFATNLFHYAVCDNSFSHVYSFFLFCALLYLTPRWHAAPNWRHTMALAAVSGLIVLVRPTNGLLLLFVPLLGVTGWTALRERLNWLWQHKDKALGGSLIFLLTVAPLPLYWKLITGHWIVDPYGVPFYFAQPQLWNVLFSVRKGLFFWSPILLLAVAGFWLAGRYWKGFALPAALYLLTQLYLVASWEDWAFGGSFGHRAFTEALAIFAVGLASMFQYSLNLPALNKALLVISLLCTLLSVKLMLQYWNGILPYDRTTWAQFVTIFFKFSR